MPTEADRVNIVRYESQKCIGWDYSNPHWNVTTLECVGVDADGQRWRFLEDVVESYGLRRPASYRDMVKLPKSETAE